MLKRTFYLIFLCLVIGCQEAPPTTLFSNLPSKKTSITFKNTLGESEVFNVLNYGYFYNGGGVAIGDINNDGLPDIYFTGNMKASHLYLNKGNWEFEEIAQNAGVDAPGLWNTGVTMADINNDGWLDIYVCRSAAKLSVRRKNLLFINNRNNTFSEMANEYGIDDTGYATQATFFDYDRDGDLDMYLLNHSVQEYAGFSRFLKSYKNKSNPAYGDKLYQNNLIAEEKESFGRFREVTQKAGIKNNVLGFGLGVAVEDLNNDGWPDIYVSNDYNEEDYFYVNQKDGTFKESIREYFDHTSLFSMGSDVADINNDGLPEVFTLDMLPEDNFRQKMTSGADNFAKKQALYEGGFHYQSMRNMLHLNNGDGSFSEIGQLAGLSNTDWSWAALFADYDNDGWKDLFVSNGYKSDYTNMDFMSFAANQQVREQQTGQQPAVADLLAKIPSIEVSNYIFKNNGDLTFANQTKEWGLNKAQLSHGAAYADLDADGDLDLVVNNVNEPVAIYRNNSELFNQHNYLKIQLRECPLNRLCYGTQVTIKVGDKIQTQTLQPTRGFQSSVEPVLNFGLGTDSLIDAVEIYYPNGGFTLMANVKTNQTLTINQEAVADSTDQNYKLRLKKSHKKVAALFKNTASKNILNFKHRENNFNDFKREPLLPNMLSTQGPSLSIGDVNKDGLEDVFIGGAYGQAGQLFIQNNSGTFEATNQPIFEKDKNREAVASLFFDVDGDKDLDLYVGSGGNEFPQNAIAYQDRLYLNNGKGQFSQKGNLPAILTSTSCVKAGDFDKDGDQDLFIGGRLIPGQYPLSPSSYILENDGKGNFTNATKEIAPELQSIGMVTDAIWTDYDQDKDQDLILVGEWMPITFLENTNGQLTHNSSLITPNSSGWWNSLTAADMDGDGDTDYIAGNFGYNSQIKVNENEPVSVVVKDFDNNGTIDPIINYYINGKNWPMPPKDDLLGQLPSLKKQFLFYEDYANASIENLFTEAELADAQKLEAYTFATSYIENKGNGNFAIKPLPTAAQFSPTYSILTEDFNKDGHLDILLGGNLMETRVQFGRYDASKGTLLLGDGKGEFLPVQNSEIGLKIKGAVRDMKSIKIKKEDYILVAKNNGILEVLKCNK